MEHLKEAIIDRCRIEIMSVKRLLIAASEWQLMFQAIRGKQTSH